MKGNHICPLCKSEAHLLHEIGDRRWFRCLSLICGLEFVYPQPSEEDLVLSYAQCYYGRDSSRVYDESPADVFRQFVPLLRRYMGTRGPCSILDNGCGKGSLYDHLPADWQAVYMGVEPDHQARQAASRMTGRPIAATVSEAAELSENPWDLVFSINMIEHVRSPVQELTCLQQGCSDQVLLFLTTPNADCLKRRLMGKRWDQILNPTHLYLFRWEAIRKALECSGWTATRELFLIRYPNHSRLRRIFHSLLRLNGLDGNLTVLARAIKR